MPLTEIPNAVTPKQRAFFKRVKNMGHDAGDDFCDAVDALLGASALTTGRTVVKTANYTVDNEDTGYRVFANKAGSEIVFTLPTPAEGQDWTFVQMQAQSMKVASTAGDDIIGKGDVDLDSVAVTGIGQALRVISVSIDDGVTFKHLVIPSTWFAATSLAALTDNSGGAAADGTIGVVTIDAITASNPAAPTAYSAHAAGIIAVTSNAATDLDTTAAALATLRGEVATYELAISALIVDAAMLRTASIANKDAVKELATKVNELIAALGLQAQVD